MRLCAAIIVLLLCQDASAQSLGFGSQKGDITITAKAGVEWDRNLQEIKIHKDATVTQGNLKLFADDITINYTQVEKKQQISLLQADGNVTITTPSETLKGSSAQYDPNLETAVLRGELASLVMDKGKITAELFEYFKAKNQAVARNNATMVTENGTVKAKIMVAYLTQKRPKTIRAAYRNSKCSTMSSLPPKTKSSKGIKASTI